MILKGPREEEGQPFSTLELWTSMCFCSIMRMKSRKNTCMHFNSILHELQLTHIVRTNGYLCSVWANFWRANSCHVVVTKTKGLTKTSSGNSYCNCAQWLGKTRSPVQKHKHKMLTTNYKRKGIITVKVGKIGKLWYSAWAWKTVGLCVG